MNKECGLSTEKLHSKSKEWHENGQLWSEDNYVNGILHGKSKEWYKTGQLAWEYDYVDGI